MREYLLRTTFTLLGLAVFALLAAGSDSSTTSDSGSSRSSRRSASTTTSHTHSPSRTTPSPSAPTRTLQVGDTTRIGYEGSDAVVLGATDDAALDALHDAVAADDRIGLMELMAQGKVLSIKAGTQVKLIEWGWFTKKIRVLSGPHFGKAAWVPNETLRN